MADTALDMDFGALRRKVRDAQHTRSVPLIMLGVLLGGGGRTPGPRPPQQGARASTPKVRQMARLIKRMRS